MTTERVREVLRKEAAECGVEAVTKSDEGIGQMAAGMAFYDLSVALQCLSDPGDAYNEVRIKNLLERYRQ